jgi:hypothetical protein
MTTEIETTQTEIHDNVYWFDEALLADTTEMANRMEQADRPVEDAAEYAALYFVS